MAGTNVKLVNRLSRRSRSVKEKQKGKYDRENKLEQVLRKSPRAFQLARKAQRREDRNFGNDAIAQKPVLGFAAIASTFERHDYSGGGDYGMRLTLPSGLEAAIGLQVNDVIRIQQGNAKGHELLVTVLTDSTHLRLEDLASYAFIGKPEITSITCVADSAGSLNSTYFTFSDALDAHKYYVWYDDGTGVDPAPVGRTGIHVTYTDNDTANTIASLTRAAITTAASANVTVSGSGANVTITNNLDGDSTDAANGTASPGFTIMVTQQGVADNPTPSESNIAFLALLSSVKASYK